MFLRLLIAIVALAGGAGCGSTPSEDWSAERGAIIDGEPSPSGSEDAVLLLRIVGLPLRSECSSSLVAHNLVLTARHCVAPIISGRFSCSNRGELIARDSGAGEFEPEFHASNIAFFDASGSGEPVAFGKAIVSTRPVNICMNDIALIVLDRALELPILPLRRAPARPGEVVTVVGYGAASEDEAPAMLEVRRRKRGVVIDRVGPDSIFDGEGSVAPRMFATIGPFACRGDSGGPALSETDGGILGIYSSQRGELCEAPEVENLFVHAPPFASLFERAFAEAGATPVFSDPETPEPGEPEPEEPEPEEPEPEEPEPEEPEPPPPGAEPSDPTRPTRDGGCSLQRTSAPRAPGWIGVLVALALFSAARRADRARAGWSS